MKFYLNYIKHSLLNSKNLKMSRFWGYSKRPKNWKKLLEENDESDSNKKTQTPLNPLNPLKPMNPVKSKNPLKPEIPVTDSSISYM
jgi:hypothetical protein